MPESRAYASLPGAGAREKLQGENPGKEIWNPENIGGDFNPRILGQRSNPKRGSGAAAHVRESYPGVRPSGRNPQSLHVRFPPESPNPENSKSNREGRVGKEEFGPELAGGKTLWP